MATTDPLAKLATGISPASRTTHVIGGIEVDIYGLDELDTKIRNVACLWLLNPRLGNRQTMRPIADAAVAHWRKSKSSNIGLIVAAFDQRNHGSRQVNALANQAWRDGNPRHAQDMFSIFQGTAADTSQLITYLPAYIFPGNEYSVIDHMALGVSLGGHSVWHLLLHESRIKTGIVIVGCPDYLSLMKDRARLSKLKSWTESQPPGASFVGSVDFSDALLQATRRYDPTGYYFGLSPPSKKTKQDKQYKERYTHLLNRTLNGKRILNLAGGADKLVPYAKAEPFMHWLKGATANDGWYREGSIQVKDVIYDGVGHEMTSEMLQESLKFITESLNAAASVRPSKL